MKKKKQQQRKVARQRARFREAEVPGCPEADVVAHARQARPERSPPYTEELANEICRRLAAGELVNQICADDHMPDRPTLLLWRLGDTEFAKRYETAYLLLVEYWAEEVVTISDDGTNDWIVRELESGRKITSIDYDNITRSRLRVDTRFRLMEKLLPKKYGTKTVQQNQQLDADGNPITPSNTTYVIAPREAAEISAALDEKV